MKRLLSIDELCEQKRVTKSWVYKHSAMLNRAKLKFNGKVLRPLRFDSEAIEELFGATFRSLTIEKPEKPLVAKKVSKGDLWR